MIALSQKVGGPAKSTRFSLQCKKLCLLALVGALGFRLCSNMSYMTDILASVALTKKINLARVPPQTSLASRIPFCREGKVQQHVMTRRLFIEDAATC